METRGLGKTQRALIGALAKLGGCANTYQIEKMFAKSYHPYIPRLIGSLKERGIVREVWVRANMDLSWLPSYAQEYIKSHPRAHHFVYLTPEAFEIFK